MGPRTAGGKAALAGLVAASTCSLAVQAAAQSQPPRLPDPFPPPFSTTLTAERLSHLPLGGNLFSLLETAVPETIADRFNSGGLNVAAPAGVWGFLHSATQTAYRVGQFDITSPVTGEPMLFPELAPWSSVASSAAMLPPDSSAPGLAVTLRPLEPTGLWRTTLEGAGSGGALVSAAASGPPPIDRLGNWAAGRGAVSGPMTARLGLAAGGSWARNEVVSRGQRAGTQRLASAFAHLTFARTARQRLHSFVWVQHARTGRRDAAVHAQSSFSSEPGPTRSWSVSGAFTERRRRGGDAAPLRVVDRLADGPVTSHANYARQTERRWSLGGRVSRVLQSGRHSLTGSARFETGSARQAFLHAGVIGETIDGIPARLWEFRDPVADSSRRVRTLALTAGDRVALSAASAIDAAIHLEHVAGQARGAERGVSWLSLLPRIVFSQRLGTPLGLEWLVGYRRTASPLRLDVLAAGDPAGPFAEVYRWDGSGSRGPLVARAGPGSGGDPAFSGIDARLGRPQTHEFAIGVHSRPRNTWRVGVFGVARRETSAIALVNTTVGIGDYRLIVVPDANVDLLGTADDHLLTIYDREPRSFGRDRYLLTNPDVAAATAGALVVTADVRTERLFLSAGATASASVGAAAHRGFRSAENDHEIPGELFATPNASAFARGRLFGDRAYVIKWTTIYRLPAEVHVGAIARYQDGQPFSRLVIVRELAQGAEAVRAFANGRSRFAFTGTLDVRVQKRVTTRAASLDLMLDLYNALNMRKEVEEYVVSGPRFREITAVQPPRAVMLGVRLSR